MAVIWLIIIGAAAGFIATRLMNLETNMITTISIGIGGALIGGLILRILLGLMGMAAGFVGAILGALLLIWLWETYGPKK
ncbi:GlsB/YeaQ/YmgE family stress response membrane protein [Marimonas lutisalis]|uniref:GlsB/YeaQ/YmgE family stress response membrane protein n=1 Tax=Marimonas lutisalis TaxID=2545756 RepID=UPI0010FA4C51|nr:GlsB/YeaQ/YmgE family stress response membrane protein [Marimonas lutisalis]